MFIKHVSYTLLILSFLAGQSAVAANPSSSANASDARVAALSKLNPKEMIVYQANHLKTPKAVVTVFTDMNCTYCHKLHQEIPKINDLGIEVRILSYPRHGAGSDSYNKMVTVWCASNASERKKALEKAMNGEDLPSKTCNHSVDDHRELGRQLGIVGTPTLIFEDGTMWSGYMPADRLAKEATKHKAKHTGDGKDAHSSR